MLIDSVCRSKFLKRATMSALVSGSLFVAVLCARVVVHAQAQQAPSAPAANGAATPAGTQGTGQGGPTAGPGAGRGRGGGFRRASAADWNDHDGWVSMFDGKTLNNWKGNMDVWSVEDGQIVGTASSDNPVGTTYLIWTGGQPANFTLKLDFMLAGTAPNTGIQFRSYIRPPGYPGRGGVGFGGFPTVVCSNEEAINDMNPQTATPAAGAGGFGGPGGAGGQGGRGATAAQGVAPTAGAPGAAPQGGGPGGAQPGANGAGRGGPGGGRGRGPSDAMAKANAPYWLSGPQADFDPQNTFSGNFYDQDGRGEMVFRGQVVQADMCKQPEEIASLGDTADLAKFINPLGQWNRYLIVARDHVILEAINDHVMSVTFDDDPTRFRASGYIGLQLEGNGKLYFKNLYVKYR